MTQIQFAELLPTLEKKLDDVVGSRLRDLGEGMLFDFPDYSNVGDSAIVLGEFSMATRNGFKFLKVFSSSTTDFLALEESAPILINGGGNLGGLYPANDELRGLIFRQINADRPVLQFPQSIHFKTSLDAQLFQKSIARLRNFDLLVRDTKSLDACDQLGITATLAPDMVHCLGPIEAEIPTREYVLLTRSDVEAKIPTRWASANDWLREPLRDALASRVRDLGKFSGTMAAALNLTRESWEVVSRRRFLRGVRMLQSGQTVVTDRLHAMLMGLQMGRRVLAVDNSTGKLSAYANTWFSPGLAQLEIFQSFDELRERIA